ncbi:uncharacterized protein LOC131884006 isoform X2 [Tigriopus californicus]|uniref:uncharacterized protein LOC131884006 isoform X2 n=1 Tax=Tigriopus californicus TaxID=6832 RepID=UPI0027DA7F4C|nr:uncharacterized protein LOC131884006 isoform X2 [Tigriopus californicus]
MMRGLTGSYENKLQQLGLTSLEDRRRRGDAILTCFRVPIFTTDFECAIRCLSDFCFGYKLDSETMTCTTLETAPGDAIVVGPSKNTSQLWLKRGHVKRVSRVALLQNTSGSFLEYFSLPNPNATYLRIPDFTEIESFPIHHCFDWGLLICASKLRVCKKWIYGSEAWVDGPTMLNRHLETLDYNQVGMVNNNLWVIGGFAKGRAYSPTEYYSPEGQWVLGPNLSHPLNRFGVAPVSDWQVLIVGGIMNGITQSKIKLFDLVTGNWSDIDYHPHELILVACARHILLNGTSVVICTGGQCSYTCGGSVDNLKITGVYDIDAGIWNLTPEWDLPMKCARPRMRILEGRLFIMGGEFEDGKNNRVLEFREEETPVWQELESLPSTAEIESVISIESSIWVPN